MKFILSLLTLVIISGLVGTPISLARAPQVVIAQPGPRVLIQLDPQVRQRYVPPPVELLANSEQAATADIQVNYIAPGWTPEAQAAFEFAAGIWEALISSPVTIVVDATFSPMGVDILGRAGPTYVVIDFDNAPYNGTWYPVATANKLSGVDNVLDVADIVAEFSSNFTDWDFGTDGSTAGDKVSFASVVLHELGHGLGFLGSMQVGGDCPGPPDWGCYGIDGFPMVYDLFTENEAGIALLSFENNPSDLGNQLTSESLYFDSPGGNFANGGTRVPIYAPSTWETGSSYSHLDWTYDGTEHALMTFDIGFGETIHDPGEVALCMFAEMGWTVSTTCGDTPISGLVAYNDSPTVLEETTQLVANISAGSNVSYTWDFGDGTGGSGKSVSHKYASLGAYTAEVTATNSISQETVSTTVRVEEAISGLAADHDGSTTLGEATQFSAAVTTGSNVSFEWDFGDGASGSGSEVSHTYSSPGTFPVEVIAANLVSQQTAIISVEVIGELQWVFLPLQEKQP